MRKLLGILKDIRKSQLSEWKAPDERLAEVDEKFNFLNSGLDGVYAGNGTSEKFAEVMTSGDFTYAIQEFVQRKALPGYQRKMFNFEPLVKMDTVPNYMLVTRYQNRCGVDDLELVTEKGQPRPGSVQDATKRQWRVHRWEKQYDLSHEALVNDDIGYFEDMARLMGESARRSLEKFVSRMYTNAVSIAALTALGALYSQNGRLTTARISEARMAYNQRTDACSEPINARLGYVVIHSGLEDTMKQILASEKVAELATNAANIVRDTQYIVDPYITGTAPNLPWWAFSSQESGIVPFVLARRAGMPGPEIRRKITDSVVATSLLGGSTPVSPIWGDFETGNIVLKVVDVWGTYVGGAGNGNYVDVRGGYYSSGTVA